MNISLPSKDIKELQLRIAQLEEMLGIAEEALGYISLHSDTEGETFLDHVKDLGNQRLFDLSTATKALAKIKAIRGREK